MFDMRQCKVGDVLITRSGSAVILKRFDLPLGPGRGERRLGSRTYVMEYKRSGATFVVERNGIPVNKIHCTDPSEIMGFYKDNEDEHEYAC